MRTRHASMAAALTVLLAAATASAEPAIKVDQAIADTTLMPPLTLPAGGRPLRDVLADVQKAVPTFHCVVTTDPGVPAGEPVLPPMQLQGVTIGQFLQFVNDTYATVTIHQINAPGDNAPLYAINVAKPDAPPTSGGGGGGPSQSMFAGGPPATQPATPPTQSVRVVSLNDLVRPRAAAKSGDGDHIRAATDDVLSAVQAALDVADLPGPPATLKVHQPTMTLIVRATDAQMALIDETLSSLQWTKNEAADQLDTINRHMFVLQERNLELERRLADREARLRATRPSTQPAGGNSTGGF